MTNHERQTHTNTDPDVVAGMGALANALGNLPHDRAQYRRSKLDKPITDTFGNHTEKRELISGRARIQDEIDAGGTLMFSVFEDNGTKKVIGIGRTPDDLRSDKGGGFMIGAGRDASGGYADDPYMMLVHQGIDGLPPKPFYLAPEQLRDITVGKDDQDVSFNPYATGTDPTEGRIIRIAGKVENIVVLEDK